MTGPAEGKLELDSKIFLLANEGEIRLGDVFVCIHLKGFSRARVTHLDIEHNILDNLIPPKSGSLHDIGGIEGGIEICLRGKKEIVYQRKKIEPFKLRIFSSVLNEVLKPGQRTRTWVGGKFGGIYIGFRKTEVEKLEKVAESKFGINPR